ncbi:activating transcription factor of chaperone [Uranotaenia lowii]|uniref:activating transcription factor of chaperone n=1 Tax=Uranotaenia lowii TaxID=190385 RepID=UPI00247A0C37|nr:activating transcription factor of chaperone [Uranotaenia lowii]
MMESFQFLDSSHWEGKLEPSSPSSSQDSSSFIEEELILEAYDFCNDGLFNNALFDFEPETKPSLTSDLMKEMPIVIAIPAADKIEKDQWLDQKLKQPLPAGTTGYMPMSPSALVALTVAEIGPFSHQQQPQKVVLQNTEQLLMEFDYVYENVELTHLTPPQTPPQQQDCSAGNQHGQHGVQSQGFQSAIDSQQPQQYYGGYGMMLEPVQAIAPESLQQVPVTEYQLADSFGFQPVDEVENIARNLELVEEIVRSRSKDLPNFNDDASCSFSEAGSDSSPMSDDSSSSYCGSAYSRDHEDDEWSPSRSSNKKIGKVSGGGITKKRSARPYGRGIEDKKSRKKEQNKNAATRYRQKKKAEIEEILVVENELREKNEDLKRKSNDIGQEIRYLKNLMREICKAKGLIQ